MRSQKAPNAQALLEPTSEIDSPLPPATGRSASQGQRYDVDEDSFSKSTAKSYWYLPILVTAFMAIHIYTVVMLCICPLGQTVDPSSGENLSAEAGILKTKLDSWLLLTAETTQADGYGQCAHGGVVPTPWSSTVGGWSNVTASTSVQGWWKGIVVLGIFLLFLVLFFSAYTKASCSDPGYVMHLSKNEEVRCAVQLSRKRISLPGW